MFLKHRYPSDWVAQDNFTDFTLLILKLKRQFSLKKGEKKNTHYCSVCWHAGSSQCCFIKWHLCKHHTWITTLLTSHSDGFTLAKKSSDIPCKNPKFLQLQMCPKLCRAERDRMPCWRSCLQLISTAAKGLGQNWSKWAPHTGTLHNSGWFCCRAMSTSLYKGFFTRRHTFFTLSSRHQLHHCTKHRIILTGSTIWSF